MTPQTGDTVRYLNSTGGGKIVKISGNIAYVDEDGFETPVLLRECVVVGRGGALAPGFFREPEAPAPEPKAPQPERKPEPAEEEPAEETEGGDVLNVVLGFEPTDIKNLSQSSFEAYLVNDSNYMIDYAIMTRADGEELWTLRRRGYAEPNMHVFAFEFERNDLPAMDRMAVQLTACKTNGRSFELKPAVQIETRLDTTRFARLHCFGRNEYFDSPVIAIDIVRNDRAVKPVTIDKKALERAMAEKRREDRPVQRKPQQAKPKAGDTVEVDLHAAELFDDLRGFSNADILNAQIDRFRHEMDRYARIPGVKLIFIHGKGNGVLREALMKELTHRYKGHDVQDASFREYGFGATQVTIRNIRK